MASRSDEYNSHKNNTKKFLSMHSFIINTIKNNKNDLIIATNIEFII